MSINLNQMVTESSNQASCAIDTLSTLNMLKVINEEDKKVAIAVEKTMPEIEKAVNAIADAFKSGGRLIYTGAGTSGRLGILDASECPPTYGTPAEQVVGIIAGGHTAILKAVENAEDNTDLGAQDLKDIKFNEKDILIGIAASGRTPYVIGAMEYAKSCGSLVGCITCNPASQMSEIADFKMNPIVGPEVITGSSRMKAGTAQKLILNMLTTGSMIRSGKVYGNLMIDVEATNAKLVERQKKIVMEATECDRTTAESALTQANGHCKTAIVMILTATDANKATQLLSDNEGFIRPAIMKA
ncbi:N-acetylmuramic acid 6-phosphate etherase [Vibrio sp.]|nr:N-acetylmuramic acid 6-phosphate etherase [Vibrio sp.]